MKPDEFKTIQGAECELFFSDGNKSHTITGVVQGLYHLGEIPYVIIRKNKLDIFLNASFLVCITVLKSVKATPEKKEDITVA